MSRKKNARKDVKPDAQENASAPAAEAPRPESRCAKFLRSRLALPLFWFVALWYFWSTRYGDFLYAIQENSLFLFRGDYATRWFAEPAGVLGYCGSFLIQFFYYPILGGAALAGLGVALFYGVEREFGFRGAWRALAILPTLALTVAATWYAYYVYAPHNASLIVSGFLGANVAIWGRAAYRGIRARRLRSVLLALLCAPGYCALGIWFVALALLCALAELNADQSMRRNAIRFAVVAFAAASAPLLARAALYFDQTPEDVVWRCGLVDDLLGSQDARASAYVVSGVCASLAFLMLFGIADVIVARRAKTSARVKRESPKESSVPSLTRKRQVRLTLELTAIFAFACFCLSFRDEPFFCLMAQNRALNEPNWERRILDLDAQTTHPCEHSVALRNLALFETGELTERAFERPIAGFTAYGLRLDDFERASQGASDAKRRLARFTARRTTQNAALSSTSEFILCQYGQTNIAARCAMNKMVGCNDRSIATFKTLAFCATASGERELARRYFRELSETLFYRGYARAGLAFLESRDFAVGVRDSLDAPYDSPTTQSDLTLEDAAKRYGASLDDATYFADRVARARKRRPLENVKELDAFPDLMRLYGVFTDDYSRAPREIQEAELISSLFQRGDFKEKDDGFFLAHIEEYVASLDGASLPKALEEGYATLRFDRYGDDWNNCAYQFSRDTTEAFQDYVEFYRLVNGALKSRGAQAAIIDCCRGTYWGYMKDESAFIRF